MDGDSELYIYRLNFEQVIIDRFLILHTVKYIEE